MEAPYFPFYPRDWLADSKVSQLTYEEQGVYFNLLCRAWTYEDGSCSLPNDDRLIARIMGLRPAKWAKFRAVLVDGIAPVFRVVGDRLVNGRLLEEYEKLQEKSQIQSANAKKRWGDESPKPATNQQVNDAMAMPTHMPTACPTEPDADPDTDIKTDRQTAMAYFGKHFPAHLAGGSAAHTFMDYGEELSWPVALEALMRTVSKGKDWNYAAAILRNWSDAHVSSMENVKALDEIRKGQKQTVAPKPRNGKYDSLMIG